MSGSRAKLLSIYPEALAAMLRGHPMSEVVTDFPADAKITRIGFESHRDVIRVRVESSTFPEVPEGHVIPNMEVHTTAKRSELDELHLLISNHRQELIDDGTS